MKKLKLFFALFAMLALGVGNAWGAEETYTYTFSSFTQGSPVEFTNTNPDLTITLKVAPKGQGNTTKPQWNSGSSQARVYAGGTMSIAIGSGTITKIVYDYVINASSGTKPTISGVEGTTSAGTWDGATKTWTGSDTEVLFSTSGTKGNVGFKSFTITYSSSTASDQPSLSVVTVSGNPTKTIYETGEVFVPTGLTVTGTYGTGAETTQQEITSGITWTANNGSEYVALENVSLTQGQTSIQVKATVNEITSEAYTANITVNAAPTKITFLASQLGGTNNKYELKDGSASGVTYIAYSYTKGEGANFQFNGKDEKTNIFYNTSAMPGAITTLKAVKASGTDRSVTPYVSTAPLTKDNYSTAGIALSAKNVVEGGTVWTISEESSLTAEQKSAEYKYFYFHYSTLSALYVSKFEVAYKEVAGGDEPETPTPSVSVAPTSYTFATTNVGETATQEFTITAENTTATLSAEISNTTDYAISDIADNKITVTYQPQTAGTHEATLTIKAGEEASTTVALKGKAVAALEGTWILVTDASSLNVGDKIIIAAKESDVALSTTQNSNNRAAVTVTKNGNQVIATSETQVLTLQSGNKNNTLALYTGSGYLYAASSSSNHLKTENTLSDNSSWNITITNDGVASLVAQGEYTRNVMRYNPNTGSGNPLFACYAADKAAEQKDLALYKNTNGKQLAGLAYATTKYLTKLGDAFTTPTLTNPNSLTVTYSSSDNNVATVDNTGTVTIKAAGFVVITATFAGNASYLEGSAKYTLCVTEHAGTEADPYSVADARRVIDVMETAEGVYATGIVSQVNTYNSTYKSITYWISADGTSTNHMQVYGGLNKEGEEPFSSKDDIKTGDEVVVKGNLKLHDGTVYEFDANNQLVSLKRDKQQAGLAYEEKEHTANVGEDFTEPTLTNPNSLSITYSSSNTTLATVDATTGEVSILAAGKVTITASSATDATYAAGSASYNITITDPSLAVATLPFAFNGNKAAIETTAGMTQNGLGSDYSASTAPNSQIKFDGTGDWVVIRFDSEPGEFSFLLKQNGQNAGTFTVYESANGEDYTPIWSGGDLGGNGQSATIEPTLSATARYVKFEYTTKGASTNYGLGSISIQKADHRAEAGFAWNPATVSLTVGDAFTPPAFTNPNNVTGIEFTSSNTGLATVTNAGVISLVSGKTGTATITATFAGDATYKAAEVKCTISVNPKTENVVILAEYNGQWYALKAETGSSTNSLAALEVEYINGVLYNVDEADKASITWKRTIVGNFETFQYGDKYLKGSSSTNLFMEDGTEGKYQWDKDTHTMLIGSTNRTFLYQGTYFKNYAISNAGRTVDGTTYSALPIVTAAKFETASFYTRTVTPGNYGTICLPYAVNNYTGATFYKVAGTEGNSNKIVFDEVTELEAGKPYIFMAEAAEIKLAQVGEAAIEAGKHKSLQGTFEYITDGDAGDVRNILEGNYMVVNNVIKMCGARCQLPENRAYFVATELDNLGAAPQPMPGRRRVTMGVTGENEATGVDNITENGVIAPKKLIENGQLIIIRDGEKYNVQGQKL